MTGKLTFSMTPYPIIGMSPGNSYFKDIEVRYLLEQTINRFGKTAILVADIPAISTYMALGYPENKARNKAIPKGNNLKNRTKRIAEELGISDKVRIIDWKTEIANNEEYEIIYSHLESLYLHNPAFKAAVDSTTRAVLENSSKDIQAIEAATEMGTHYLLSELAFLEFSPTLLATEQVAYVYHKNWPVYEDYLIGKFDGHPKKHLEFLLIENPYETYKPLRDHTPISQPTESAFARIMRTKTLHCSFTNYPPSFIEDEVSGEFSGIFYDLIMSLAAQHNLEVLWTEESGYGVITDGLEQGRFDLFCAAVWPTPEREKAADFSIPVYFSEVSVWVRENDLKRIQETDLHTNPFFRVTVKEGDMLESIALADFPNARKIPVPQLHDPMDVLEFVANDRADATFAAPYIVQLFNSKSPVKLRNITGEAPIRKYGSCFMLRNKEHELKQLLDAFIEEARNSGLLNELFNKYTGKDPSFDLAC